ncbi:inositol monophosphatase family protein [Oceanibium sediminis]|uniref:inositol monophosphatase family protein n=1 Tax=Oceanibium sediminis TaxID=2026339 RepID=UPI000DD4976E|nr:inositol monophosphatase [Oceanibium sediminis]
MNIPHQRRASDIALREAVCIDVIQAAGEEARRGFSAQTGQGLTLKGPQDFLTETDLAVEKLIKSRISESFPGDGFLGEETGGDVSGNYWVVDPIDGTANFARGIPHYAVVMAYVHEGEVALGAIFNPETDELYVATRGKGATRNGHALHTAPTRDMESASVELGWSNRLPNQRYIDMVSATLDVGANARRASSGALGLAFVADGRSDGYAELHMNAWDCLAGLLLVQEAGGIVGGTAWQPNLQDGGSVLAATPAIAAKLSAASSIALA